MYFNCTSVEHCRQTQKIEIYFHTFLHLPGSSHNPTQFAELHIKKARLSAHQYFDFFSYCYDSNTSFFLPGFIIFDKEPSSYPFGESIVSFVCEYWLPSEWENKSVSLEIQLRRYANDNWTSFRPIDILVRLVRTGLRIFQPFLQNYESQSVCLNKKRRKY